MCNSFVCFCSVDWRPCLYWLEKILGWWLKQKVNILCIFRLSQPAKRLRIGSGRDWKLIRGPGIWYPLRCACVVVGYLSVNTAQVSLLLKITHWRFLKVIQRATIVTVGGCSTANQVVRDDRTTVKIEPCIEQHCYITGWNEKWVH